MHVAHILTGSADANNLKIIIFYPGNQGFDELSTDIESYQIVIVVFRSYFRANLFKYHRYKHYTGNVVSIVVYIAFLCLLCYSCNMSIDRISRPKDNPEL